MCLNTGTRPTGLPGVRSGKEGTSCLIRPKVYLGQERGGGKPKDRKGEKVNPVLRWKRRVGTQSGWDKEWSEEKRNGG